MKSHPNIAALPALLLAFSVSGYAGEIVADANTVILDHFNGSTTGTAYGTLNYETSMAGMGQAGSFGPGNYVKYGFNSWFSNSGSDPANQGTVEMWVKFETPASFLTFNWGNTTSPPGAGYVLYAVGPAWGTGLDAFGYQTWNGERGSRADHVGGSTAIPIGEWVHLALTWGPSASKIYVNGVVDAVVYDNVYPALNPTTWAYLNNWGTDTFSGLIDEFFVSKVQRTDAQIAADAGIPEPGTISLLALGALLIGLRTRRPFAGKRKNS